MGLCEEMEHNEIEEVDFCCYKRNGVFMSTSIAFIIREEDIEKWPVAKSASDHYVAHYPGVHSLPLVKITILAVKLCSR